MSKAQRARGAPGVRRLGRRARPRRARRDPRPPPRPRGGAARRARGRGPARTRADGGGGTRGSRAARAAARRLVVARRTLLRAVELEPTPERRYLAAHAAWRLVGRSDGRATRPRRRSAEARAAGLPDIEGRALVLLADLALHAESDVVRGARPRGRGARDPAGGRAGRSLRRARADRDDLLVARRRRRAPRATAEAMLELAHEAGRPELESLALTQLVRHRGRARRRASAVALLEARRGARRKERQPRGDGASRSPSTDAGSARPSSTRRSATCAQALEMLRRDRRRRPLRLDAVQPRCVYKQRGDLPRRRRPSARP